MRRTVLALVACLLLISPSFAQQNPADAPASREQIEEYMNLVRIHELMKIRVAASTDQLHQLIHGMVEKQPDAPQDLEARMDNMADDILKDYPIDEMLDAMIPVYQKHLTKGDVDSLIGFYSSPTRQKILKELPAITKEATEATTGAMQKLMARIMERIQEELDRMAKEGNTSPAKKTQQN